MVIYCCSNLHYNEVISPVFVSIYTSVLTSYVTVFCRASEVEMISKIVMDVSNELPSSDFDQVVGLETHVEKMISVICLESDEVKIVGIWGPAGIGKTTIARALYKQLSSSFQLKFYMENFEGKYNRITRDPVSLQTHLENEIHSGVLDHRDMKIPDLEEVQSRLKHQRVLLILDDISSGELQALGNLTQGLTFGSKVIVTNENLNTLMGNGINQIYKVAFPSREEAQKIFSYSAFGRSSPPRGYLNHAVEVANCIAPFPLGLKILGSALRGKSRKEWKMTPAKLKTYLHNDDTEKAIRYVYDSLSEKHKKLFGSLKGSKSWGKDEAAIFLLVESERDWDVESGIQTLADLALISITREGGIIVHHHLVEKLMWEMSILA